MRRDRKKRVMKVASLILEIKRLSWALERASEGKEKRVRATIMNSSERFRELASRVVGKRLTFAEVTGKVKEPDTSYTLPLDLSGKPRRIGCPFGSGPRSACGLLLCVVF